MSDQKQNEGYRKFVKFLIGCFLLILGTTLVLVWWSDVVSFVRGVIGMMLAVTGLFILYLVKD